MYFSSFISQLPALAALLGTAAAVNIQAWQGSGCGVGGNAYYADVGANTCVAFSNSFGVQFQNMPSGGQGQVYYNSGCSNFAQAGGSGTYCLDAHNNMKSANWFYPSKRLMVREPESQDPHTGFEYTAPDGTRKYILCSASDFDHVFALLDAEDWAALAEYPEDTNPPKSE